MPETNPTLSTEPSNETLSYWISQPFISDNLRKALSTKTLLLTPSKGYADHDILFFPNGTYEFLEFLRENQRPDFMVDICIEDTDYKELALHFDVRVIADFITTLIAAPVAANLITEWIKKRSGSRINDTQIKVQCTIVRDEKNVQSIHVSYEGGVLQFEETLRKTLDALNPSDAIITLEPNNNIPATVPLLNAKTQNEIGSKPNGHKQKKRRKKR